MNEYSHKVDFVLPWVDGEDQQWLLEKRKYSQNNAKSFDRFRDLNTLKYVLRSIEKNCPWYNKIYIITTGHYPKWLDINHPRISLITHEELYYDKSHLPVFNSCSIEMNLGNIKGLSKHFVYLNDDTFILQKVSVSRFFKEDKPVDFLSHSWIARNKFYSLFFNRDTWIRSLNNINKILNREIKVSEIKDVSLYHKSYGVKTKLNNFLMKNIFKKLVWLDHWHHPQPYLKSTLEEVYFLYKEEMMISSKNKFRQKNDLTPYIYRYWQLMNNNFYAYKYNDGLDADIINYKSLLKYLKELNQNKSINFVCFNDQMKEVSDIEFKKVKEVLNVYLESKFPNSASFEFKY